MNKETQKELFNLLYRLEDIYDYDNSDLGKEIGELVNKLQKELLQDKEIQKVKRAFNYKKTPYNLKCDLITYIKQNLYDDNISVQRFGKMYVFNWSFTPQTAGTLTQQMSYQAMKIEQMANKIINHFSGVDEEKTKIID
tara:strand:+ start:2895 stop:3311 length:417 start_codon:yes stop_codon:yes gene_type:complete